MQWIIIIGAALLLQIFRYDDIQALSQLAPYAHINLSRSLPTMAKVFAWPSLLKTNINILCAALFLFAWIITKPRPALMQNIALFLVLGLLAEPLAFLMQIYLERITQRHHEFRLATNAETLVYRVA